MPARTTNRTIAIKLLSHQINERDSDCYQTAPKPPSRAAFCVKR